MEAAETEGTVHPLGQALFVLIRKHTTPDAFANVVEAARAVSKYARSQTSETCGPLPISGVAFKVPVRGSTGREFKFEFKFVRLREHQAFRDFGPQSEDGTLLKSVPV